MPYRRHPPWVGLDDLLAVFRIVPSEPAALIHSWWYFLSSLFTMFWHLLWRAGGNAGFSMGSSLSGTVVQESMLDHSTTPRLRCWHGLQQAYPEYVPFSHSDGSPLRSCKWHAS